MEITRARAKPVTTTVAIPCGRCLHREVCGIRPQIEALATEGTELSLPELNPALTPTVAVAIECGFFLAERKAQKVHEWTPAQRQAARERLAARRQREKAAVAT